METYNLADSLKFMLGGRVSDWSYDNDNLIDGTGIILCLSFTINLPKVTGGIMSTALLIGAPLLLVFFTVVTFGAIYLNKEAERIREQEEA